MDFLERQRPVQAVIEAEIVKSSFRSKLNEVGAPELSPVKGERIVGCDIEPDISDVWELRWYHDFQVVLF